MRETAYAKVNLALHVRARRADGYHEIETVFAFADAGDELAVAPADRLTLETRGPFAAALGQEADNLVLRAARALAGRHCVRSGAALTLDKRLPVAAGIGGGSADAAAALRLLTRFWGLPDEGLGEIAASLGADVPACLASRSARGSGRGDLLAAIADADWGGRPVLLVNPLVPVSTAAVFAGWDGTDRGPIGGMAGWRNDLEAPARAVAPEIGAVLEALADAPFAAMSGSGATCFALFDDEDARDALSAAIAAAYPGWWRLAGRLR